MYGDLGSGGMHKLETSLRTIVRAADSARRVISSGLMLNGPN